MKFEESFFEGEEIDGFYVRPMMKRVWAAQMEILSEIDAICKRHNIMYFAEWGTLLGIIRHRGFIPWDDDIDIGMKREDYERFLHFAQKELPPDMEILNAYTDEAYGQVMSRVRNGDRINMNREFLEKYHGCPYVVGVDIFPRDYVPCNKEEEQIQLQLLVAANLLAQSWQEEGISWDEKVEALQMLSELSGVEFDAGKPMDQQLFQLSDRLCALFGDTDAEDMTQMCVMATNPGFRVPKSCYASTIDMPFEHITIPVPVGYDEILKKNYGENYMLPVNQRGGHDYPFFQKQEIQLREWFEAQNKKMPECFAE